MKHFMKPHFFDQDQRQTLDQFIDKLKISDQESRDLFIRALEYELAEYEEYEEEEAEGASTPAPKTDSALQAAGSAANELLSALGALSAGKRDRVTKRISADDTFSRNHDERYLSALEIEICRLSRACETEKSKARPADLSPLDQKLIAMMAEAYEECFEKSPSGKKGQPFARLAANIVTICNLNTPVDEASLAIVLEKRRR